MSSFSRAKARKEWSLDAKLKLWEEILMKVSEASGAPNERLDSVTERICKLTKRPGPEIGKEIGVLKAAGFIRANCSVSALGIDFLSKAHHSASLINIVTKIFGKLK